MELVLLSFLGVMITGGIWMLFKVNKDSNKAVLAWLFLPFYSFVYISGHWNEMKKPFYVWLAGTGGMVITVLILEATP
ncbi:unnamed protein product [marine sediment metagenome]|uniref:Histidine kinase N-terminal 7TM region domain-containing protein n=1 Tax=marine sediment metagenome TaxID=412755 RepID=X1SR28_9ZZZZ